MTRVFLSRLYLFCVLMSVSCCSPSTTTIRSTNNQTEAQRLIEELASRFPPANEDGYWGRGIGIGLFDSSEAGSPEEQDAVRVRRVYTRLQRMGIAAFDDLVAASADHRHSFSAVYAAWNNHTVGDACFMIIESQVDFYGYGYKSRPAADGRYGLKPQYLWHVRGEQGLEDWWNRRRDKSLRELQIESLLWTIAQEESLGFTDQEQQERIIGPIQRRLEEIKATSSP